MIPRRFLIWHSDSTRTARLKILYLLPLALVCIPLVGLLSMAKSAGEQAADLAAAYHHKPYQ